MTLGMRSREGGRTVASRGGTGAAAVPIAISGLLAVLFSLLLSGCGGGGGGGSSPAAAATPPPSQNQATGLTATVTGNLVDANSGNAPATGVVVAFGKFYTLTSTTGAFSLSVPAATAGDIIIPGHAARNASGNLVLNSNGIPTTDATYFNSGSYNGNNSLSLTQPGIPIPATTAGQIDALGQITLYSTVGPPGPPPI